MADLSTLARPYAKAAFDYAKEHHAINEWQDYLNVMSAIVSDKAFADYINNPAVAAQAKVATLKDLYNQISPEDSNTVFKTLSTAIEGGAQADSNAFVNFLTQLAEQDRLALLPSINERFGLLKAADAKEVHAYVTSAYPLTQVQEQLIEHRLATSLGAKVVLHVNVDPALIAGVTIKVGDKVIDDSVRGKLKQLKTQLTA
ncbi:MULTISPECIES: F0F1 ATP synthase subunit delta [Pseudomonadota]|uniref:ATP synthase subunit delta n=1 Tax=Faucicola osloensis TaxID=34062 RepID=A0A2I1RHH0_FAUOS|nr:MULTISPECIES: F0F1 ATP synthase subunit delta [Pseudomonadota]MCK6053347.1 F0F1 ATP synthase subunit delta [Moraxella osloensis]MCK6159262.1 F0F1 ATP synthase subunit delta [Moraxella osloensis]PKZ68580.1 F0F1 ATP synthase subunit delta [Moraxella osloensis]VXB26774.1 ATP synthase subunit delta [Enhydrobacter sp. 8BJ]